MANKFSSVVNKINSAPVFFRSFLLTKLFSYNVKYAGTTGIKVNVVNRYEAHLSLQNKKKGRNHIGSIHAIAAALLAESATGIIFGVNVPNSKLPLLKSMKINYQRRIQGDLMAIAKITDEQISQVEDDDKGNTFISVVITDESDLPPIECLMEWAWVTKK